MNTFNRITPRELEAVRKLKLPELVPILQMLEAAIADVKSSLVTQTDVVTIHRLQGKAVALEDFLDAVKNADRIAERTPYRG